MISISNMEKDRLSREVLSEWAMKPGAEVRQEFAALFQNTTTKMAEGDPVVSISMDNNGMQFDKNVNLVPADKMDPTLSGLHDVLRFVPKGAVPGNFSVDGVPVPSGVVLIVGGADTAKTPLSMAIARLGGDYAHIRYGEPLAGYNMTIQELARSVAGSVIGVQNVSCVVLDSMKDVMITAPGAAMASGLSRGIWPMLSSLSSTFSEVGKTLIIPMNPATLTEGVVEMITESAKSNVSMVIASEGNGSWVTTTRRGEGLKRVNSRMSHKFDNDGMLVLSGSTDSEMLKGSRKRTIRTEGLISDTEFDAVLRRNFNHLNK